MNGRSLDNVIDALRDFQTGKDSWKVAEALAKRVPNGDDFTEIMEIAEREHVLGKFKIQTLRQYRDAAKRWPAAERVDGVSFTAHREVLAAKDAKGNKLSVTEQADMLRKLVKSQGGADKVTTAVIREALRAKAGKAPKAASGTPAAAPVVSPTAKPGFDALADIKAGATKLIASIDKSLSDTELAKIKAGLEKVLGHVENIQMVAARKKAAQKKAAAPKAPAPATTTKATGNGNTAAAPRRGAARGI